MPNDPEMENFCARVGELVLWASVIDQQLTEALIKLNFVDEEIMLHPLLSELDARVKAANIKVSCKHITAEDWKRSLKNWTDKCEKALSKRNIVAHHAVVEQNGNLVLKSPQARKILNSVKDGKASKPFTVDDVEDWISQSKKVVEQGQTVLENLSRFQTERKRSGS